MAISRDEVLHVARLARLALMEDEVERLTDELAAILDAVGIVAELDLADVPPTSHPLELVNVSAEDVPDDSLPLDAVLANAPHRGRERAHPGENHAVQSGDLVGVRHIPKLEIRLGSERVEIGEVRQVRK